MSEESDLVAKIITNDINTLVEDLNNVIKAHNVLVDENQQLKDRINQTRNTIETTISIIKQQPSSDKELDLYFINQLERYLNLLKGDKE